MITIKSILQAIEMPFACLLLLTGVMLTWITNFPQLKFFGRFIKIITSKKSHESHEHTITPLQALFAAMSTSLGMGSIAGPPIAVAIGGPGALFWLIVYGFFGCVTKLAEVVFAVKFKRYSNDGAIIGGPTAYLYQVHPFLAHWYALLTIFLFSSWSGLQANTMAAIYNHYGVPEFVTGIIMALFIMFMLFGGAKRIGDFSSKLVPFMCLLYFSSSLFILCANLTLLKNEFISIFTHAFSSTAALGGFAGATVMMGIRQGIFKGAFITEAGVGTAAIPHALADTKRPLDQGILAMYSIIGDIFFCIISGLIALITGTWLQGIISNDLTLQAYQTSMPTFGPPIIILILTLFITGTAIGNSFNGSKSFAFFTNNRWMSVYNIMVGLLLFAGSITHATNLWDLADFAIPLVALPNIVGIVVLTLRYRNEFIAKS